MNTTDTTPESQDFDFKRAECLLPPTTSVYAYLDQAGALRIWATDAGRQCDSELHIPAEDVHSFVNRLAKLVGTGADQFCERSHNSVDAPPLTAAGDSRPLSGAERVRRHREKKRNGVTPDVTPSVTPDRNAVTREATE
jgi:hypothetical protein